MQADDNDSEDYEQPLWDTPTHNPFPGPCCRWDPSQHRCVLLLTMAELCFPRPGGMDPALCLFPKRAAWVALQLSTVPANELGALGLTNTFCVTAWHVMFPKESARKPCYFYFYFLPCLVLDLRQAGSHSGVSSQPGVWLRVSSGVSGPVLQPHWGHSEWN